jgi:hypothetical protein
MSLANRYEFLPLGAFQPCGGRMRLHGGGDGGGSSSSNSTTTTTTNVDRRQVVDNGAVGITSDGGTVNISNTKTDYGVIAASAGLLDEAISALTASTAAAGNAIERAYKDNALSSKAATDAALNANKATTDAALSAVKSSSSDASTAYKNAGDFANAIAGRAFDLATTSSDTGFKTINTAIGFVKDVLTLASDSTKLAASGVSSAYSTAQDSATGTRFLMTAALAIGGIILVVNLPKMKGG